MTTSQTSRVIRTNPPPPPELPVGRLSPKQHKQAVQLVDKASKQRLLLGAELLQAAQAHTARAKAVFDQVRAEQNDLKEELHNDLASSLQTYDQWMAQFDQRFTARLKKIETRVDTLSDQWSAVEQRIVALVGRAEKLLDHMRQQPAPAARSPQPSGQLSPQADAGAKAPPQAQPDTDGRASIIEQDAAPLGSDTPSMSSSATPANPDKAHKMVFSKALEQLHEEDRLGHGATEKDDSEAES